MSHKEEYQAGRSGRALDVRDSYIAELDAELRASKNRCRILLTAISKACDRLKGIDTYELLSAAVREAYPVELSDDWESAYSVVQYDDNTDEYTMIDPQKRQVLKFNAETNVWSKLDDDAADQVIAAWEKLQAVVPPPGVISNVKIFERALTKEEIQALYADSKDRAVVHCPPAKETTDDSSWIKWRGGECPVAEDIRVDVKFSDGEVVENELASFWTWSTRQWDPIIAYRISRSSAL